MAEAVAGAAAVAPRVVAATSSADRVRAAATSFDVKNNFRRILLHSPQDAVVILHFAVQVLQVWIF
ncbi:MAG: hypothetical protein BWY85_01954 [Firmicutes bacterium ADurb.Bin506]|nr:MAG: hypothetical protein BWY85_01954 [Firmicutes bacterium ADurb.Bin506]